MITICFTPQLYLGFKFTKSYIFNEFKLPDSIVVQGSYKLYNEILVSGGLTNIVDIKTILNKKFNLYEQVVSYINAAMWEKECRPALVHEISDIYDTVVTAIHFFTKDIFNSIAKCYQHPPLLLDISHDGVTGYIYV